MMQGKCQVFGVLSQDLKVWVTKWWNIGGFGKSEFVGMEGKLLVHFVLDSINVCIYW